MTGGKRVFRMAPIHHHFELGGWSEFTVMVRLWILCGFFVLVASRYSTSTLSAGSHHDRCRRQPGARCRAGLERRGRGRGAGRSGRRTVLVDSARAPTHAGAASALAEVGVEVRLATGVPDDIDSYQLVVTSLASEARPCFRPPGRRASSHQRAGARLPAAGGLDHRGGDAPTARPRPPA